MTSTRKTMLIALTVSAALTAAATAIIHSRYETTLRREIEESTGQVGQLRVEAASLRAEQDERRHQLEILRGDIQTAEQALSTAQRAAEESQCQAQHARVDAAVTMKQVECYQLHAQRAECVASRERSRADNTLFGALLGAGAAVMTGGSSLLLTAGGGLVGSTSGGVACPIPQCELNPKRLRRSVLAEQGIARLVQCTSPYEPKFLSELALAPADAPGRGASPTGRRP